MATIDHTELLKSMNIPQQAGEASWVTGTSGKAADPALIYERRERRARLTSRLYGGTVQDHINAQY